MITQEMIETFLSLAETKSVSTTAILLNISQSTASHRIASLEDELGATLFDRGRGQRNAFLTAKGHKFLPIAESWDFLYDRTKSWDDDQSSSPLSIGALETFNTFIFAPLYEKIMALHPAARLRIRTRPAADLYRLLNLHEIDVGLTVHSLTYPNVIVEPLFRENYMLILPEGLDYPDNSSLSAQALSLEKEIFIPWERQFKAWHENMVGDIKDAFIFTDIMPVSYRFLANDPETWMIAPATVAYNLPTHLSRNIVKLDNPPPPRNCFRIRLKMNNSIVKDSLDLFNNYLDRFILNLKYTETIIPDDI